MNNNKISKIAVILSIVAIITSVLVLVLNLTSNNGKSNESNSELSAQITLDSTSSGNIAYVNLDTLLLEYKYSIKLNEDLLTEQAKAKANLEARYRAFEKKYNQFMEKMRLGSFISQSSMEAQQKELVQEQSALEKLDAQLTEELMTKQTELNKELYDTVMNYIKLTYKGKYSLILGNAAGSSILYAEKQMDITREVIDALNSRYSEQQTEE